MPSIKIYPPAQLPDKDISETQFNIWREELEVYLSQENYEEPISNDTTIIVDFMSFVRSQVINAKVFTNFESLVTALFNRISSVCVNRFIHIIFDSYKPLSIKGPERESRGTSILQLSKI